MEEELQDKLLMLYKTELGIGPLPTSQIRQVAQGDDYASFHGHLSIFLAGIAGIASQGKQLRRISNERQNEFRQIAKIPFFVKYPEFSHLKHRITSERVPDFLRLMKATEEARLLILQALAD
jgi:hypothetical protein